MHQLSVLFTRANEPPVFNIPQEQILDPLGPIQIALREGATSEGNPSITMVIPLAGGMTCIVETTYRLWEAASRAFAGRVEFWNTSPLPPSDTKE